MALLVSPSSLPQKVAHGATRIVRGEILENTTTPSSGPIFLLDIGNTRLKWALLTSDGLVDHAEATYTPARIPRILTKHWAADQIPSLAVAPSRVMIASVGKPNITEAVSQWMSENWALPGEFIKTQHRGFGVTCAYHDHSTFGVDRWVALVGVRKKHKKPVCVVDCGTALTVDALAANGKHLGGLIVPGIGLMRRTLTRSTERIGQMPEDGVLAGAAQNTGLGRSTEEGVMAGTVWAAVAFIDRVVADLEVEFGQRVTCILAGGDAMSICPLLNCNAICEPDLVLQGLAVIAKDKK